MGKRPGKTILLADPRFPAHRQRAPCSEPHGVLDIWRTCRVIPWESQASHHHPLHSHSCRGDIRNRGAGILGHEKQPNRLQCSCTSHLRYRGLHGRASNHHLLRKSSHLRANVKEAPRLALGHVRHPSRNSSGGHVADLGNRRRMEQRRRSTTGGTLIWDANRSGHSNAYRNQCRQGRRNPVRKTPDRIRHHRNHHRYTGKDPSSPTRKRTEDEKAFLKPTTD